MQEALEIVGIIFSMAAGLFCLLFGFGLNDWFLTLIGGGIIGGGFTYFHCDENDPG